MQYPHLIIVIFDVKGILQAMVMCSPLWITAENLTSYWLR